ncbi:MAG: ATP-binding protein [Candidatus Methanoplasma sp.]|jgi:predicted AAA+ superfamily ATPase|nr:ATP-binding protein [Candidatus Methanoplasma sp.]
MSEKIEIYRKKYIEILNNYRSNRDIVKIITGIRRCGKSTILRQYADMLKAEGIPENRIISLNLEEQGFIISDNKMLYDYIVQHATGKDPFILLDEIQLIRGWEKTVNTIRVKLNADFYITGSNAEMFSHEFGTLLTGRFVEIHAFPLSFAEFMERYPTEKDKGINQRFDEYLQYGGMPIIDLRDDHAKNTAILEGVYDSIIVKDLEKRSNIDVSLLQSMTSFVFSNVGKLTSATSIVNNSYVGDHRTVEKYLNLLCECFIFYKTDNYDVIGKKFLKTKAKYYAADVGMRNAVLKYRDTDTSSLIENVIYIELLRRGYEVVIGSYKDYEIDFTARIGWNTLEHYQVSKTPTTDKTHARETRPLKEVEGRKIILTMDRDIKNPVDGIEYINITDFLLEGTKYTEPF